MSVSKITGIFARPRPCELLSGAPQPAIIEIIAKIPKTATPIMLTRKTAALNFVPTKHVVRFIIVLLLSKLFWHDRVWDYNIAVELVKAT
jgi:hypothetical protein